MDPENLRGKRVLLVRTDRIGDLILSFPVVEALKAFQPEVRIDVLVNPSACLLGRCQRNVSTVLPDLYRGVAGLKLLVRRLRAVTYDLALHLYPRPLLSLACALAGVPVRVGTAYRWFSALYTHRARIHRKHMAVHERDLNLQLLASLGVPVDRGRLDTGLAPPEAARTRVRDCLMRQGIRPGSSPFVVLHPGSGGSSLAWPGEHYAALAGRLAARGVGVVVTGTETDRTLWKGCAGQGRRAP